MDEESRLAVLEEQVRRLDQERVRQQQEIEGLKTGLALVRQEVAVVVTRVGTIAGFGALVGGAIVAVIVFAVEMWLKGGP